MYTALISVKAYDNVYCIGEFKKSAIKVIIDTLFEYEHLKQNDLFSTIKKIIRQTIQLQPLFIMHDHFQNIWMI